MALDPHRYVPIDICFAVVVDDSKKFTGVSEYQEQVNNFNW